MIRAPRLVLSCLLVLMQCLAPWVHAHTGVETGGFLHLPGLEFLAGKATDFVCSNAQSGEPDLIVGVQAGKWDRADVSGFVAERQAPPAVLPVSMTPASPPPLAGRLAERAAALPPFVHCRPAGYPRAPPPHSA